MWKPLSASMWNKGSIPVGRKRSIRVRKHSFFVYYLHKMKKPGITPGINKVCHFRSKTWESNYPLSFSMKPTLRYTLDIRRFTRYWAAFDPAVRTPSR